MRQVARAGHDRGRGRADAAVDQGDVVAAIAALAGEAKDHGCNTVRDRPPGRWPDPQFHVSSPSFLAGRP
jgi:hypothetical protein